jgi:hypothetical protein
VNLDAVRRVADAVLYEGYILYPYRASAQKNRSRWQFGVVMAPGYAAADPSERSFLQAECVLEHTGSPAVLINLRFLQVQRRTTEAADGAWDEAVAREVEFGVGAAALLGSGWAGEFAVPGGEDREPPAVRRRAPLAGAVSVLATAVPGPGRAMRLRVRVENRSAAGPVPAVDPVPAAGAVPAVDPVPAAGAVPARREDALPSALVAAHLILTVSGGEFVSMTDPPTWARAAVAECENIGVWPVLAGQDRGRQVVLASPIILYDHPELAPESPGELYDGTEIDEILTLRTMALTEEEKREARATDPRAAALIDRVDSMDAQTLGRLHGTLRGPRPVSAGTAGGAAGGAAGGPRGGAVPWWDPDAEAAVSPDTDAVVIGGQQVRRGSRVRLRPGARRADAQDMFLAGRIAEVQAVLLDVDDNPYLAVSLADDPDQDLRVAHGRFLYFATDEVEPAS